MQDEQFVEEQDEHPEPAETLPPADAFENSELYLPLLTFDTTLRAFLDLHFGHTALGFSLKLKVMTSNFFLHLSHSNS